MKSDHRFNRFDWLPIINWNKAIWESDGSNTYIQFLFDELDKLNREKENLNEN